MIRNTLRWLTCWMPMRFLSKRVERCLLVASPYHFNEIRQVLSRISEQDPNLFSSLTRASTIICDARFGSDGAVTRFCPPFACRIITIVTERGASPNLLEKKLVRAIKEAVSC
ncbi:MAG: hypothetical protein EAZ71_10925 [Verrucomicrobia bacterium]|nr:MAG: hypothetical protein EAZ71_10925 [Verrucomicrobiota bacterium]